MYGWTNLRTQYAYYAVDVQGVQFGRFDQFLRMTMPLDLLCRTVSNEGSCILLSAKRKPLPRCQRWDKGTGLLMILTINTKLDGFVDSRINCFKLLHIRSYIGNLENYYC